jgi:hypothetical protein
MKLRYASLLIPMLVLITSCKGKFQRQEEPVMVDPTTQYEYKVGLGYGLLGKRVQVTIDGCEVISVFGTDEIEQYAQLQGTKMLAAGFSPNKDIMVRVTIDGGEPFEQAIDLSSGMFIHIYQERTGLRVFNTPFLLLE